MHAADVWQPGVAGADNGIIVFVFPEKRTVRVEVGHGIESVLPDAEVRRLVETTFVPAVGTSLFFPGTFSFGGGGVDLHW